MIKPDIRYNMDLEDLADWEAAKELDLYEAAVEHDRRRCALEELIELDRQVKHIAGSVCPGEYSTLAIQLDAFSFRVEIPKSICGAILRHVRDIITRHLLPTVNLSQLYSD